MFSLTSEDEWNPESANVDSFLIKTAPLTYRWVDVKIYLSIKKCRLQHSFDLRIHTQKLSLALKGVSFPSTSPDVQRRDPAWPPPSGMFSGSHYCLSVRSHRALPVTSYCSSTMTGTALLESKGDWNVNCFKENVSSSTCLAERKAPGQLPQGGWGSSLFQGQSRAIDFSQACAFCPWKRKRAQNLFSIP